MVYFIQRVFGNWKIKLLKKKNYPTPQYNTIVASPQAIFAYTCFAYRFLDIYRQFNLNERQISVLVKFKLLM